MRAFIALIILLLGNLIIKYNAVAAYASSLQTYMVHVEPPANAQNELSEVEKYYLSFMPTASRSGEDAPRILFSYQNVFFGFAAKLSDEDVKEMETKPGFLSAGKEEILHMDTTYSPSFLGLLRNQGFWNQSNYGSGIIIGVLDTGINPGHPSFGDSGMPIRPITWRGVCEFSSRPGCNNKLIGARSLVGGEPLDANGHGTHVAGIAAGNFVNGVVFEGNATWTAAGIAARAHLAVYKVCDSNGCPESAVLAGMDAAIGDRVDIISMSLSGRSRPFYLSNAAVGAFAAMERGIFVSCSAGNSGPSEETLSNEAPWVLTVGASTTNRQLTSTVLLGNNRRFDGQSAYIANFSSLLWSTLIYPGLYSSDPSDANCGRSQFPTDIRERIVICLSGGWASPIQKGIHVRDGGGRAMILINQEEIGYSTRPEFHVLPASHVSYADGLEIIAYLKSTTLAFATLSFGGTSLIDTYAPSVGSFSSRGPNGESYGILKPDILGPGVDIIAASHNSNRFVMMSGTSMACAHLSGVAALLKRTHPNWPPAAIKSAIMTSANVLNLRITIIVDHLHQTTTILDRGSGQLNPSRANNPGLIYDLTPQNYINYLCGLGYTPQQIQIIVRRVVDCRTSIPEPSLNYPSFSVVFGPSPQTYSRILTNVGVANSTYRLSVAQSQEFQITVNPDTLAFTSLNQRLSYQVTFRLNNINMAFTNESLHRGPRTTEGSIIWTNGDNIVRTPVVGLIYQNPFRSTLESLPLLD